ncbi:hypothetical protein ASE85_03400 [Sphingobium sp. Leaf26]|uniref:hypothetical protein n=1 Tax=Sphingobium sp. Leaf26 TaxID=1735693 RepID=UPI0006F73846|nr:hypothetical protein [Sphingobium sp. Leaf26]KQN09990.1 hypothetical protein ASE85_03400 [Sphingobium sp. Leaf26]
MAGQALTYWGDKMISVYDFEEFWLANPVLEKALLGLIDIPLSPTTITVDGAQVDIAWVDFGGVRSAGADISHPEFSINFETVFDAARVEGDKYRVILSEDERLAMLESFDGPAGTDAFQAFFKWLADNTDQTTYPAKIKAAAATFADISR